MSHPPTATIPKGLPRRKPPRPLPTEPVAPGPRRAIASARNIAGLLEQEPGLWPGLTTYITDTDGRMIVHYAVSDDSTTASSFFGPDGVVALWRSVLAEPEEARREVAQGNERVITVHGKYAGYIVTVLFTVFGPHPAPTLVTSQDKDNDRGPSHQ